MNSRTSRNLDAICGCRCIDFQESWKYSFYEWAECRKTGTHDAYVEFENWPCCRCFVVPRGICRFDGDFQGVEPKNGDDAHTECFVSIWNWGGEDAMPYKNPIVKINIRMSLRLNGICSLSKIGSGRMKIATSVTIFRLDLVYQNINDCKHRPWILVSQYACIGIHVKTDDAIAQRP